MEKKTKGYIVNALRRIFRWTSARKIAKDRVRIERAHYRCEWCKLTFKTERIRVDHIKPVVPVRSMKWNWDRYINRMFVDADGLQVLCLDCHKVKTDKENKKRRENKKK